MTKGKGQEKELGLVQDDLKDLSLQIGQDGEDGRGFDDNGNRPHKVSKDGLTGRKKQE